MALINNYDCKVDCVILSRIVFFKLISALIMRRSLAAKSLRTCVPSYFTYYIAYNVDQLRPQSFTYMFRLLIENTCREVV